MMNRFKVIVTFLAISCATVSAQETSAPTFFAYTLDNKPFFMSKEIEKEQPIVLSFFATWCGPCRQEIPVIDSLSTQYSNVSFYLVNVSGLTQGDKVMKENDDKVIEMLKSLKVDLPVLMDKYGKTAELYDALVLPRVVIIDKNGNIVYAHTGYDKDVKIEIQKTLTEITNGKN